jgi:RIO-like serine/threonine protein kinase
LLNDSLNLAQTILKSQLKFIQNDLFGSEKGVSKVLKIMKILIIMTSDMMLQSLGLIYNDLEDYNAMVYHNKALASIDESLMASFSQPKPHL